MAVGHDGWRWQGRQYHMWFGHGTKPEQERDRIPAAIEDRVHGLSQTVLAALPAAKRAHPNATFSTRNQAHLQTTMRRWVKDRHLSRDDFARTVIGQAPDDPGVKDFHDAALSLGEAATHAHLRDAADEFSRGMSQVGLDQFPRFLANAADLAGQRGNGALQPIQYRRGGGPTRMPGGGWREVTPGEMIRMDRYGMALERLRKAEPTNPLLQSLRAPNSIPSEEFVQRVEAEATAAQQRAQAPATGPAGSVPPASSEPAPPLFSFVGPGSEFNVFGGRNTPGVVTATGPLPHLEAPWPANAGQQGVPIPAQVAAQLVGRTYGSVDAFRAAFWKAVAKVPELAKAFPNQIDFMKNGAAPFAPPEGQQGRRNKYELHHNQPINQTGPVYDLSNMSVIVAGRHIDLHRK